MLVTGSIFTFVITEDNKLYSWGHNGYGQLGLGNTENKNKPELNNFFHDKIVNKIICGCSHTYAILDDGFVFSWGDNTFGQLGLGHNIDQNKPQLVEFFKDKIVNEIICGSYHTFAIVDDGSLFSWGFNTFGQLGLGHKKKQNKPQLVDFFKDKIVNEIICGSFHTFAIVNDGSLFSWGFNKHGELGLGHNIDKKEPQLVNFFQDKIVNKIICGSSQTYAIVDDGSLFSWGNNFYGQLGLGHNVNKKEPQLVDFFKNKIVSKIICGSSHTFAIVDDGSVFSWGYNKEGQCGYDHTVDCSNGTGQLGLGHNTNQNLPQLVDFFKDKIVNEIICSFSQTFAIVDDDSLFSWGDNFYGQLGLGHNINQNKPQLVDFFKETKIIQSKKTNQIKSANSYID